MKRILLLALGLSAMFTMAQNTMTPQLLWDLGRVGSETLSPDGQWLIYSVTRYNTDENSGSGDLFLMNMENENVRQITDMKGSEYNVLWHPNGNKIGFLNGGDWYEMDAQEGTPKKVYDLDKPISNVKYAPDGSMILFTMEVKTSESASDMYPQYPKANALIYDELMYRHWDEWSDNQSNHIFYTRIEENVYDPKPTDIMLGEPFDSPLKPFGGSDAMVWSPNGDKIVYSCKKKTGLDYAVSTNSDLYEYDLETGKTRNLTSGMMGYDSSPQFSPNGEYLTWLSMQRDGYESDKNRIYIMRLSDGEKKDLTTNFSETVYAFTWGKDSKSIFFEAPWRATQQLFELTLPKNKNKMPEIRQITDGDYNYLAPLVGDKFLVAGRTDMNHAKELFKIDMKKGEAKALTHVNDAIYEGIEMSTIEKRMISTTDGKEMLTWVIYPPNFDPNKKYPTLLYCQGGPQSPVSQFYSFRWNFQLMAAQGYVVVAPNRRGLPGFGSDWNEDISKDWGGQAMEDYLAAIDAVAEEPFVDKNNIGAVGASYGGYSVYYLAGIHEGRFSAFISHCGLFNLESWYGSTEELFFANWDIGGPYWGTNPPESYAKFSPHKKADNWDTPILVIHGGKDFRVPYTQGLEAYQVAQIKGIPSKLLFFPEEGHWILSPQNGLIWHAEFFKWLDEYLK